MDSRWKHSIAGLKKDRAKGEKTMNRVTGKGIGQMVQWEFLTNTLEQTNIQTEIQKTFQKKVQNK